LDFLLFSIKALEISVFFRGRTSFSSAGKRPSSDSFSGRAHIHNRATAEKIKWENEKKVRCSFAKRLFAVYI
jgi:hypothetical protein